MMENLPANWKEAFWQSPGPTDLNSFLLLTLKGFFMGVAHVIPGVSGGTIALISGIYIDFLEAIKSANLLFFRAILTTRFKEAVGILHLRFLFAIFFGMCAAIISLAQAVSFLLEHHSVPTGAFFMGLIAASAVVVGKNISTWLGRGGISFVIGALSAYYCVGILPAATPDTLWFVFLVGAISICAMILPGLSGAFVLLVLGKYAYVINAIKNPFYLENAGIILVFCLGCVAGMASFSRVLSFLMKRYSNVTLAFLTGLMAGSLRKIWPWKETLETTLIQGKVYVLQEQNLFPGEMSVELGIAIFFALLGFILILFLERSVRSESL